MSRKTREKDGRRELDLDKDCSISAAEISVGEALDKHERADAQRRMAWVSMISMIVFTAAVFLPIFPDGRIKALSDLFWFVLYRAGTRCWSIHGHDCLHG